jgi:hypothetical protein
MLGEVDDGGTPAPGTSTCMLALALEEELLVERDDPERVSLPTSLFIILQKSAVTPKISYFRLCMKNTK